MPRKLRLDANNKFALAYEALEDEERKKDFREEFCHEFDWCKATFYNRINSGHLSLAEEKTFMRLIYLYAGKY